jgi:hypothetical protein
LSLTSRTIIYILPVFLVLTQACTKKEQVTPEASAPQEKPFKYCVAHSNCSGLRNYEAKCRLDQNEKDCREFVSLFEKMAIKNDCKRTFDTGAVPSVWICDEDAEESAFPKLFERSATTLSTLKYPFAIKFYGSEAFRSTLDGAIAEEHLQRSKNIKSKDF